MAQRKPPSASKPTAKKATSRPAGKPAAGSSSRAGTSKAPGARKPPPRKPGRSIVNQKQTPWGVIAAVTAVVLFAAAVVVVVLVTHKSSNGNGTNANNRWALPALPAALAIKGVEYHPQPNHTHVTGTVQYNRTPPTGGNHNANPADCSGTVYPHPIANENAVHALEHGSVWVTYKEGLPASQVATLAKNVTGQDHVLMSPFPNLKTAVSLQAWGYQLFLNNVNDPRIAQFISTLAANPKTTPEVDPSTGKPVSCTNPAFKQNPSTFGHPH